MAKTLSNLQTETRIYLDESSQLDWLDSEVLLAINRAYQDLAGEIANIYQGWPETVAPFTYAIVANQQEYPIDATLLRVTRVEINYSPTATGSVATRALPIVSDEMRLNLANSAGTGNYFNAGYYLHGPIGTQQIGFIPIPQTADTTGKSISVWGIQMPVDLVNGTDNVNIPHADRFAYLISLRAAAQLLRKGQQEEATATRYLADYEIGLGKMRNSLTDRQSDGVWMVEDVIGEDIDYSTNAPY